MYMLILYLANIDGILLGDDIVKKMLSFSKNVTSIGDGAFDWASSISDVFYRGSKDEKEKIAICSVISTIGTWS